MKHAENLKRLLTKFRIRYGEHDSLVKIMQQEFDSLNEQSASLNEQMISRRIPAALMQTPMPTAEHN